MPKQQPGMFGSLFPTTDEAVEEQNLRWQAQNPLQANAYASARFARDAGGGLARAGAALLGKDTQTRTEKRDAALKQIQGRIASSGAKPGSDEYFALLSSELQQAGLVDESNSVAEAGRQAKLVRAQTGSHERANQPKPLTMQEQLDQTNQQLLSDPDNPLLLARQTALERILKINDKAPLQNNHFPIGNGKEQPHISYDNGKTWQPIPGSQPRPIHAADASRNRQLRDIIDPLNDKRLITIDIDKFDEARYVASRGTDKTGIIGIAGREPVAAKRGEKEEQGTELLRAELDNVRALFGQLNDAGAIPSSDRGAIDNAQAWVRGSTAGQIGGRIIGSKEQDARNQIQSARLRILNAIKNATGMSAQQLNSNMELKTWLDSITSLTGSYESNMGILDSIENAFLKNKQPTPQQPGSQSGSQSDVRAADNAAAKRDHTNPAFVIVISPEGVEGSIARSRLQEYLTKGFQVKPKGK
jgi:hypothetical protein